MQRMKRVFALLAAAPALVSSLMAQTSPLYLNVGSVPDEVQIDATVFDNRGFMTLTPVLGPYDTQSTDYYYNSGLILAEPGIRFQYIGADGLRRPSLVFSNAPSGRIEAVDGLVSARNAYQNFLNRVPAGQQSADQRDAILNSISSPYRSAPDSYLNIYADTIINRGALFGSAGGQVAIVGKKVDLARSIVGVNPPPDQTPDDPGIDGGFDPIPGASEVHWGYSVAGFRYGALLAFTTNRVVSAGVTNAVTNVTSTARYPVGNESIVVNADGTGGRPFVFQWGAGTNRLNRDIIPFVWSTSAPDAASATATNPATNQSFTIVMVRRASTNLLVDAAIAPVPGAANPFPLVTIRITGVSTNNITGADDAVSLIFVNSFGPDPQGIYLTNRLTGIASRPTNLTVSRATTRNVPSPFTAANTANTNAFNAALSNFFGTLRPALLGVAPTGQFAMRRDLLTAWTGPGLTNPIPYTNQISTNGYMAYRMDLSFGSGRVPVSPSIPDISPTNNVGRLVIDADELNLERARIRGQGPVILRTRDLVSTKNASIDAPFIDANLATRSGNMDLSGVFQSRVQRMAGTVTLLSTTFTNTTSVELPPPPPTNPEDPPGTPTTVELIATYHVMLVDADITPTFPTPVIDLSLSSTNITIGDSLSVTRIAALDTENLTINGRLEIRGNEGSDLASKTLDASTAPKLKTFVNTGIVIVSNTIALGNGSADGLRYITNNGQLRSGTIYLKAEELSVGTNGVIRAESGSVTLEAKNLSLRARANIVDPALVIPANSEFPSVNLPGNVKALYQLQAKAESLTLGEGTVLSAPSVDLSASHAFVVETNGAAINAAYRIALNGLPASVEARNLILNLQVPAYQEAEVVWPGADRNASATAFDGSSVASLTIDGAAFSGVRFKGDGGPGALYVRTLNLSTNAVTTNATGVVLFTELVTDPGYTVYYTAVNRGTNALDPAKFEAAAALTGGRFRQVQVRGGGEWVTVQGLSQPVHQSLRFSSTVDSDGDGIVNAFDPSPFDKFQLENVAVVDDGSTGFRVTWDAAPLQSYTVEYTTSLDGTWKTLQRVSNPLPVNQTLWVRDPIPEGSVMRAYRVMLDQ